MDVKDKIARALTQSLEDPYVRLEDDDGISGFVVSPQSKGMSSIARQELIDAALNGTPPRLTLDERRRVLMIAGLTPVEFNAVGAPIRVHQVKEIGDGAVEVFIHGRLSDAEYSRGTLNNQKGIRTFEPKYVTGESGGLMSFQAKGTPADPLTKAKAVRYLKSDRYIEVLPNA